MNTQIRTLAELQAEKQKLKMQMEISKREFVHSFGYTKTQTKDFLIKKVALPAGVLGLATMAINKFAESKNHADQQTVVKSDNSFYLKIMPIVLPMIRAYLSTSGNKLNLPSFLENLVAPKREKLIK